ncbi:hypothetical protein HMPREF9374_0231 [Desmospora sp. 8437]|nr:hypothetical protein HMPREF9374_0231 [Desmospora sp. 8437]
MGKYRKFTPDSSSGIVPTRKHCEKSRSEGGLGFTWSDFGSEEQRNVKPNPDHLQT